MEQKTKELIKDFKNNFSEDFNWEEAEVWLESSIKELIKDIIPKKISQKQTNDEIRNYSESLDDVGKQTLRAKNYGWNLCVESLKSIFKPKHRKIN